MLPKALKIIRKFSNLTQKELSEKLGISKSYLSEIESGKKTISVDLLYKYESIFKIPASSILLFSEESTKKSKTANFAVNKVLSLLQWVAK